MVGRWLVALAGLLLGAVLASAAWAAQPTLLVYGDSLSAGYGLDTGTGWVSLLEQRLRQQGYPHRVINASVSGETTAGGLARLPAALSAHQPDIVLLELGGNDGLRGLSLKAMRTNLARMIELARAAGAKPVLFEMRLPPNYGAQYADAFRKTFGSLASAERIPLVPFFLIGIALQPEWFQEDGLHPNATAQPRLLNAVWPVLEPILRKEPARAASQHRAVR